LFTTAIRSTFGLESFGQLCARESAEQRWTMMCWPHCHMISVAPEVHFVARFDSERIS